MRLLQLLTCLVGAPQVLAFLPSPISFAPSFPRGRTPFVRDEQCKLVATTTDGAVDDERRRNIFSRGYRKYLDLCKTRPWPTKAVSGGVVAGIGAILSQWIESFSAGAPFVINWHQLQSFALAGLIFEGPYMHWWYEQLWRMGRWLDAEGVSSRLMTMAQIFVDQTIGVVVFFPAYFYAYEIAQSMVLMRCEYHFLVGCVL
jgi:hypothetical protein